jgi:hypothetical protein
MALTYQESSDLMNDFQFRGRVKVAMLNFCNYIYGEPASAPAHNARYRWAQQAMLGPDTWVNQITPQTVLDPNVQSAGSAIDDPTLQTAVEETCNKFI